MPPRLIKTSIAVISGVVVLGCAYLTFKAVPSDQTPLVSARDVMAQSGSLASRKDALGAYVKQNASAPDERVQDAVTQARMKMAYLAVEEKQPEVARQQFLEAEKQHAGSDTLDPAFGSQPDQARYQATNCLMLEGKQDQAKAEYLDFLKDRPLSPLVFAVHKRLTKLLSENEPREEIDRLLQLAVDKQAAHARREMSLCGPRAIVEYAERAGLKADEDDLRKVCGTTDEGTTLEGMVKGLESIGVKSDGYLVNRVDFQRRAMPFMWLESSHYVLVTQVTDTEATVYDPMIKGERKVKLPLPTDKSFTATILSLTKKLPGEQKS